MSALEAIHFGIDLAGARGGCTLAGLDQHLGIAVLEQASAADVMEVLASQPRAVVAVNGPVRPNLGLMMDGPFRKALSPAPRPGSWTDCRVAEYDLWQRGLRVARTPAEADRCPAWKRRGFSLYQDLLAQGFGWFSGRPGTGAARRIMETDPLVCYAALLERLPFRKKSLEGRIQRQLVLYTHRVDLPNPLRIFEEFTRYRLLQGILPLDDLLNQSQLDALSAAYAASIAAQKPDQVTMVGDPAEGQVLAPVRPLLARYD